jgi:serine/threonine-protein kinase
MTCEGAIVGTPEYMAPEQVLGSMSLDVRVDLYAVGVVLYEALTGNRTFFSKDLHEILSGVMTKKVPSLRQLRPEVPSSLERVIARAMARDPAKRYQTAAELQKHLIAVREELSALPAAPPRHRAALPSGNWDAPTTRMARHLRPSPIARAPETLTTIAHPIH